MIKEQWKIYKQEIKEAMEDLRTKGRRKKQIPNILTSLRFLAPAFILPASFFGNIPLVLGFVAAFSVTDMLDGFIARTFHLTSKLGKDLDAFCDKVFAGTLLLAASFLNPIMLVNFSLEGMIAGINIQAKLKGKEPKSLYIGKAKTFFLFPLLGLSLVANTEALSTAFKAVFGITTGLQILTVFAYQKKYQVVEDLPLEESSAEPSFHLEEGEEETEKQKNKVKTLEPITPTQNSQNITILKDMKELLLKETAIPEEEKNKENIKK